jgi:hypothetical protein
MFVMSMQALTARVRRLTNNIMVLNSLRTRNESFMESIPVKVSIDGGDPHWLVAIFRATVPDEMWSSYYKEFKRRMDVARSNRDVEGFTLIYEIKTQALATEFNKHDTTPGRYKKGTYTNRHWTTADAADTLEKFLVKYNFVEQ